MLPTPPARRRPKYTHSELHNQVFGHSTTHSRIPTPRQLPSPPSTTASRYGTSSSPSPSPPRHAQESFRRSMAGTSMNRSSLSTHPSDSAHRLSRQLPIVPGGGVHPTRGSPPRHYGLPSTPSPSRRLSTPTIARSSPSFSPLPSVPEPEALDPLSSDSPPTSNGRSFQPLNAQRRVHEINQLPYRGIASATLPQKAQPNPGASLSRTMSLPLRPLPHTSRNNAMIDSSPRGTPFSGRVYSSRNSLSQANSRRTGNDSPSMRLAMSTLSQFPPPPRAPLPPVPNSRPVSKLDRSKYPFV